MSTSNKKLAVLIDADNAPADCIDAMLEEIAKYGTATVKRIYGDWSHGLSKWKAALLPHAIIPVQQFAYTKGKNATDMALVIDAMDLLYSNNFDGFCLVSSDSDFTRLASRIRESGLTVYGFGEKKTPESFRKACDKFTYIEVFRPQKVSYQSKTNNTNHKTNDAHESTHTPDLTQLIKRAVKETADDFGWAKLVSIGNYISKVSPDFDSRLYGFGKLSDLIKSLDLFEHRTDNNQLQVRRIKVESNKQPEKITETPNHATNLSSVSGSLATTETDNTMQPEKVVKKRGRKPKNSNVLTQPTAEVMPSRPTSAILGSLKVVLESPDKGKKNRMPFTRLIPLVQQAIDATADSDGWATLGKVAKQLDTQLDPMAHGFADSRDIIHAVYPEWIETKKIGRGERVRNNKRFIIKD